VKPRFFLGEIFLGGTVFVAFQDGAITSGLVGSANGGEPFKKGASRFVEPHFRLPIGDVGDGAREVHDGVGA
jgi:hypothetical protein